MANIVSHPLFGIAVSIMAYVIGKGIQGRFKLPVFNPLLIAVMIIVPFLTFAGISYDDFNRGGSIVTLFLAPATAALALSIYRQRRILRQALLPVVAGCLAGSLVSLVSVKFFCALFELDDVLTASLLPKSVTGAIAMDLGTSMGGVAAIATAATLITGIAGSVMAPLLIRLFRISSPVATGIGIGASSHGLGTAKALELGEVQGAMSGIAIGLSGLITVILFPLFF